MFESIQEKLILGSSSPRRSLLLAQLGLKFQIIKPGFEEIPKKDESPTDYVKRNSEGKAAWIYVNHPNLFPEKKVLTADTIVVIDNKIIEKPTDKSNAVEILNLLSGRTHYVFSSVSIGYVQKNFIIDTKLHETKVNFKTLSQKEIEWYLEFDEAYDKSGAYGLQGIGSMFVSTLEGSYTNVIGLPVCETIERLLALN